MFCRNCGTEIPEGNAFCEECGAPVRGVSPGARRKPSPPERPGARNMPSEQKMPAGKRRRVWLAAAAILVVAAGSVGGYAAYTQSKITAEYNQKQELAARYLLDEDYDAAIETYDAMIEIRPAREEAYIGLADTYIAKGDYKKAAEAAEKGEEETGSKKLTAKKDAANAYQANEDYLGEEKKVPVDKTYDRYDSDGGLISSLKLDDQDEGNPRWIDISMDSDRVMTIALRGAENGEIKILDTKEMRLSDEDDIKFLGARHDVYTCAGTENLYLCIGYDHITGGDESMRGVKVFSVQNDALKMEEDCYAFTSLTFGYVHVDDNDTKRYAERSDDDIERTTRAIADLIRDGSDRINAKMKEKEIAVSFQPDEYGRLELEGLFFDESRKGCKEHIAYIQFGEYKDGGMSDMNSGDQTHITDYTGLREKQTAKEEAEE